jgi:hypothetical protein
VEDAKVEGEQRQDDAKEGKPEPGRLSEKVSSEKGE